MLMKTNVDALTNKVNQAITMPTDVNRRHALFICSDIGDATSGMEIDVNDPTVVTTFAGKMNGLTGTFGGLNFGVPVRMLAEADMVRH